MSAKDGGPAFPFLELDHDGKPYHQNAGLSMRDYFAIHASEADILEQAEVIRSLQMRENMIGVLADGWRTQARYMHADAMLAAREAQ